MDTETFVNRFATEKCENNGDLYMFIGYLAKCVDRASLERFYAKEIKEMEEESA